jgi:hypothetical protein
MISHNIHFDILHIKIIVKFLYFSNDLLPHASKNSVVCIANFHCISKVRVFAIFLLLTVGNKNAWLWNSLQWNNEQNKQTPWPWSASELYRQRDRRFLAKLMTTFGDTGCRVVTATDPHCRILGFLDRSRYYFFQVAPQLYSRG